MSCPTCHGEKATEHKFKMPNPSCPSCRSRPTAGFMALQQKKPEVAKFMGTQVKPTMARCWQPEWEPTQPGRLRLLRLPHQDGAPAPSAPPARGRAGARQAGPGAAPAPVEGLVRLSARATATRPRGRDQRRVRA